VTEPTETTEVTGPADGDDTSATEVVVRARGHENVSAAHASTLELTSESFLTPAGNCILGIEADRTPADFPEAFREACRSADARITATLEVRDRAAGSDYASRTDRADRTEHVETITGRGHPDLTFADETSMVIRTSEYVDDRTVMVGAGTAAGDIGRDLVGRLAAGGDLRLTLRVR